MSKSGCSISATVSKKVMQDVLKAVHPTTYTQKATQMLNIVSQEGKNLINQHYENAKTEYLEPLTCSVTAERRGDSVRFKIEGKNILFAEYGAGISALGHPHPTGKYGIGTYPNQEHAFDPNGWYYTTNEQGHRTKHIRDNIDGSSTYHTYGNKPLCFVYNAISTLKDRLTQIAKGI